MRRRWLALIVVGALLAAGPAQAQAPDSLETAKRAELDRIKREAAEKREAATRLKGQETQEISQLKRTERQLNMTRRRLRNLQSRQGQLGMQLHNTQVDLQRSTTTLQMQKDRLARRLRNLYKYGVGRPLEFLLSPASFAQLLARWDFLVMVAEQDRVLVEDVMAEKEVVETNRERLEANLTEISRTTKRTDQENTRLAALREEKKSTVRTIQTQRQSFEAAAVELEKTARSTQKLLAQLEKKRREESDRARAQGKSPQPYTGDFGRAEGALDWPLRGVVRGHFGPEVHPKWGTTTMNNGIDIEAAIGTPVHSVAKGRVDYVSDDFGTYGQIIVLNHGDGYYTLYGHLSSISVTTGQEVAPGQIIGHSGDTGSLKGPVLHFEIRKGAQSLDPEQWLE
jgi:septal ring factor EnvC (AmiA/AmiB activator)